MILGVAGVKKVATLCLVLLGSATDVCADFWCFMNEINTMADNMNLLGFS